MRRGHRRWTGYLAHVTETCDERGVNVITAVATTVPTADSTALPGIHARLRRRRLLPAQHLVVGGRTSVAMMNAERRGGLGEGAGWAKEPTVRTAAWWTAARPGITGCGPNRSSGAPGSCE
ncbi:hypothetical protein ACFYXM_03425 [Streptomyces sp. NPDC002476]|uniref:hypothetical protein n=1 Tax=Streptomyces sp. NPDC002476 TaxID=3364648 RepID=UPI0036A12877